MTNPALIPLQSDFAYLVKLGDLTDPSYLSIRVEEESDVDLTIAEDAPTVIPISQDSLLSQDLDSNLDNFYVKVVIDEQNAALVTIPIHKDRSAGRVANLPLHSFFMSHSGRFRVVKSNRTWFNPDMRNRYSVAGRLF